MFLNGISGQLTRIGLLSGLSMILSATAFGQAAPSTSAAESAADKRAETEEQALLRASERESSLQRASLLETEQEASDREKLLQDLGATPRTGSVDVVALTLNDIRKWLEDPEKRESALAALPQHGAQGLQALRTWWKKNRKDRIATERTAEAALAFGASSEKLYKELIANQVASPVVARALTLLRPLGTGNALLQNAVAKMKGDEGRGIALTALSERGIASAVTSGMKFLVTGGVEMRQASARALGRSGDRTHIRRLVEQLQREARNASDENLRVRFAFHWALSTLGGPDAVAPLIAVLDRKDDLDSIVAGLVRVGFPSVNPLTLVLKSGDKRRTPGAVAALLEMGEISAPYLADLLVSRSAAVRGTARDLLIAIHHETTPDDIESLLRTTPIDDPGPILDVLVQYESKVALPVFRYAFQHASAEIRRVAVRFAGLSDMEELAPDLMKAVVLEREPAVQLEMVKQLHRMGIRESTDILADLAEDSPPMVRVGALEALADLGTPADLASISKAAQESSALGVKDAARNAVERISGLDPESRTAAEWNGWAAGKEKELAGLQRPRAEIRNGKARTLDGGELPFRVAGDEGAYIIVLHGGPDGDSNYLLPFFDHLGEDWRVVTFNLRGRDGSKASRKWLEDYAPESDVQDVEAVRRALEARKVILVGHDFGALIALRYAQTYPQHVGRMVLLNVGVPSSEEWPIPMDRFEERLPSPWKEAYARIREEAHLYTPTAYRQLINDMEGAASLKNLGNLPVLRSRERTGGDAHEAIYAAWGAFDLSDILRELSMKSLVLATDGDVFSQESIPRIKKLLARNKRVRFHVLTGASHFPFLEKRSSTMEFIADFLSD